MGNTILRQGYFSDEDEYDDSEDSED